MTKNTSKVARVPARRLRPPRHGARPGESLVDDVRESLARHGQLQPIIARSDGEVIVGDQRRRSLRPDETVDVLFVDVDEMTALEMRLSEEYAKTEQSAAGRADMIAALATLLTERGEQPTAKSLAARIGSTPRTVDRYLRLASLPMSVKAMLARGEMGSREAAALAEAATLAAGEKTKLAKKFAAGTVPGGSRAREVVRFVEAAPDTVRERLVSSRRVTFEEAQRAARRHQTKAYRTWLEQQTAMRANAFFVKVADRIQSWVPALQDVAALGGHAPEAQRDALRSAVTALIGAGEEVLRSLDTPKAGVVQQRHVSRVEAALDSAAE